MFHVHCTKRVWCVTAAKDFAVIFNKVVDASEKAKLSMKLQADKHRNPTPDYKVGQQVWLSTNNFPSIPK